MASSIHRDVTFPYSKHILLIHLTSHVVRKFVLSSNCAMVLHSVSAHEVFVFSDEVPYLPGLNVSCVICMCRKLSNKFKERSRRSQSTQTSFN